MSEAKKIILRTNLDDSTWDERFAAKKEAAQRAQVIAGCGIWMDDLFYPPSRVVSCQILEEK